MSSDIETLSAEIHKQYCEAYKERFGVEYHTGGDYDKLDEATKNYDRALARWHLAKLEKVTSLMEDVAKLSYLAGWRTGPKMTALRRFNWFVAGMCFTMALVDAGRGDVRGVLVAGALGLVNVFCAAR